MSKSRKAYDIEFQKDAVNLWIQSGVGKNHSVITFCRKADFLKKFSAF